MKAGHAVLVALALVPGPAAGQEIGVLLERMEATYAKVGSYTARFIREERVNDVLRPREEALLKFQRPGRIYLRWIAGPPRGREILFVEGRDDGKVLVHEPSGWARFFTAVIAPDSSRVLKESRHPITDVGLGPLIALIAGNARRAVKRGELSVVDRDHAGPAGSERRLELVFPRDPGAGYYAHRALVSVDQATDLPVAIRIFEADDRLVAFYAYRNLTLNVKLTALDFEPTNPAYGFPRWRLRW